MLRQAGSFRRPGTVSITHWATDPIAGIARPDLETRIEAWPTACPVHVDRWAGVLFGPWCCGRPRKQCCGRPVFCLGLDDGVPNVTDGNLLACLYAGPYTYVADFVSIVI